MKRSLDSWAHVLLVVVSLSCEKKNDDPIPAPTPSPPSVDFIFLVGEYGNVQFSNGTTDAHTFAWSFGDGAMSDKPNPEHVFGTANSFIVTLTATGAGGTSLISKTVAVANSIVGIYTGRSWRVYDCDDTSINEDLTLCPAEGCTSYEFTSSTLIIMNQGSPDVTHTYTIVANELILVPGYTEDFLLSNFTGTELTVTTITPPMGSFPNCRSEMNFER